MAAPPPPPPQPKNNVLIWGLVGCAGLLVSGLCVATGLATWFYLGRADKVASPPFVPSSPPNPPSAPLPGPGPALPPPPPMQPNPRVVTATVTATSGSAPVTVGATCTFDVERHSRAEPPGFWCRAQISCGGVLLYGGPNAGYFPCQLYEEPRRDVVGREDMTTAMDSDAAMSLDTRQGSLVVRDDASGPYGTYSVEARVTEVR